MRGRQHAVAGLIALACIVPLLLSACGPQAGGAASLASDQTFTYPYTNLDQINQVVLDPAAVPLPRVARADRMVLVLGSEGHGLAEYYHQLDKMQREYDWMTKYTLGPQRVVP